MLSCLSQPLVEGKCEWDRQVSAKCVVRAHPVNIEKNSEKAKLLGHLGAVHNFDSIIMTMEAMFKKTSIFLDSKQCKNVSS